MHDRGPRAVDGLVGAGEAEEEVERSQVNTQFTAGTAQGVQALYEADKWRVACDLLDVDIRSGYVRVLWELWAAGLADESLAAGWRSAMGGWRRLLESAFADWAQERGIELPLSPRALSTLVANVFQGIEIELLAGVTEAEAPHREVLDALGALIARAEADAG